MKRWLCKRTLGDNFFTGQIYYFIPEFLSDGIDTRYRVDFDEYSTYELSEDYFHKHFSPITFIPALWYKLKFTCV